MTASTSEPPREPEGVHEAAASGVRWLGASRLPIELFGIASAIALARLVSPAEFGRAAVANAITTVAVVLTFEGLGAPLVQRSDVHERDYRSTMFLSLVLGGALSLGLLAFAGLLGRDLFDPRTALLIAIVSPSFVVAAAGASSMAALQRRLDFRALTLAALAPTLTQASLSVLLAALGLAAVGLASAAMIATIVSTLMLWRYSPPPAPRLDRESARTLARFGLFSSAAGLAFMLRRQVAYLVLGARIAPTEAGLFYRAFLVGGEYQAKVSGVLLQLLFPLYSRARDRDHLRSMRQRVVRVNSVLTFPLLTTFVVVAPEAFPFVFGDEWRSAVLPAQILAGAGAALALLSGSEPVAIAAGRPRDALLFNATFILAYAVVLVLVAPYGLIVISVAAVAVHIAMVVAAQWVLLGRSLDLGMTSLFGDAGAAVVCGAASLAAGLPCAAWLRGEHVPGIVTVAVGAIVAIMAYGLVLRCVFPQRVTELRELGGRVMSRRQRGEPGVA